MLKKRERLTKAQFNEYFKAGRRSHSPHIMLIHSPSPTFHASAVISKKVAKTAVARNKFRRRVYAVFERLPQKNTLSGVWICIAKSNAASLPFNVITEELTALIHKTGILR